MNRLERWVLASLRHPGRVLAIFGILTVGWALLLPRLYLETDGRDLFAEDAPAILFQDEVDARFVSSQQIVLGVEALAVDGGEADIFSAAALDTIHRLTERIEALPGVAGEEVKSLSTEPATRWESGALRLEPPIWGPVTDAADAAEVAEAALAEPLFERALISADRRGSAIYVPLDDDVDRAALFHELGRVANEELARLPAAERQTVRVHLLGAVASEALLGEHVLLDLVVLLPLALGMVALVLAVWFRRASIVFVGLGEGMAVVIWGLGSMAALGRGLSLVTVVMPVILATYCVADTIHIGQRFREKHAAGKARLEAMEETVREILRPVVFTSLSTAAGFLAFALGPIPPIRDFGFFTAWGILCALGTSTLVVPVALLAAGFGADSRRRSTPPLAERGLRRCAALGVRSPLATTVVALVISAGVAFGITRIEIQDSWLRNFDRESPLVEADAWFNRGFMGSNIVQVILEEDEGDGVLEPGGVLEPAVLRAVAELESHLEAEGLVGGSRSIGHPLRAIGRTLESEDRLPASSAEAGEWSFLYRMAGGRRSLDPYVDEQASSLGLWLFLNRADYRKTAAAVAEVDAFLGPRLAAIDDGPTYRFAGDAYLGWLLIDSIARSQRSSLLVALVATCLIAGLMFASPRLGLLAVVPVVASILWNFGFMGWVSLPLGVATSTFSAIALGIGVDFSIHWLARLELAIEEGRDWLTAVKETSATAGAAIFLHGLVLALGFAVLVFSSVPPNARLGVLICINLLACLGATLLLLPALSTLVLARSARGWAARGETGVGRPVEALPGGEM